MILLDTCTILWLVAASKELSSNARELIQEHAASLYVSSISALEIGIKHNKGKLKLPLRPARWFPLALEHHGIREIAIRSQECHEATSLPALHSDPFDRLIIATAMVHHFTVLTPDPHIAMYPGVVTAW